MRVLLDHRVRKGGVDRYARLLISGLLSQGEHEVDVAPGSGLLGWAFTPWGRRWTGRRAEKWSADVVHGLHFETPKTKKIPTVTTVQDLIPLEYPASMPSTLRRHAFKRILTRTFSRADRIIVPSQLTARSVTALGCDRSKVDVVPIAVDPVFRPLTLNEIQDARARFAGGRPYAAAISHGKPHKNMGALIEASRISTSLPLICAGGESLPSHLKTAGVLGDIDLRLLLGGANVFVLPSILEGYGLPALEASACGTRVICGERVGATEHLVGTFEQVDVTDPAALAEAMQRYSGQRTSNEAGMLAASALTVERMASETLNVYRKIA